MDPNATWEELVRRAEAVVQRADDMFVETCNSDMSAQMDDAVEMAERILALRDWLQKGGFPPKAFTQQK